ncbi:MAG: Ig-like domain-containing protein [Caldilineaceae bacterium]|nr:Ig-like domain-containing protein [Caldilineaceae bacterium]
MDNLTHSFRRFRRLGLVAAMVFTLLLTFWVTVSAQQATPLSPWGYLGASFDGYTGAGAPTGEKPESKLWWNDGFWWGSLFNSTTGRFHIYKLNWGTQLWEDTGVELDNRPDTKADILWDGTKLYVASHVAIESDGEQVGNQLRWARFYRYSYNATLQTYTLDGGFPVTINQDVTEALVLSKANTGQLWITYVSRGTTANPNRDYRVFVNVSTDDGLTWGTPFVPTLNTDNQTIHVKRGDLSAIVTYGSKVGIMWNNTISDTNHTLHFAYRDANNTTTSDPWTVQSITVPGGADDHISIRSLQATGDGQVFAAIKTSTPLTDPLTETIPLIGLIARDVDGTISFHSYSRNTDKDTRPTLIIDEGDLADPNDNKAYIFVSGKEGGSKICYKALTIKSPLSSMGNFPVGNCGTDFIEDLTYKSINNATTMKQHANKTTGIVVLASDHTTVPTTTTVSKVYVHNVMGNPPPVTTAFGPSRGAVNVALTNVVTATFSKPLNETTINTTNFSVVDANGPVAGTINYDVLNRTATFVPNTPFNAGTSYTVRLTNGLADNTGLALNAGIDTGPVIEEWNFSTGDAGVQFASPTYSVNELAGTATITVVLDTPSAEVVTVDYATSDGTATAGSDYTAATGTVTFNPGETVKTFTVNVLDDATQEMPETVNLTLSNPVNAALGVLTTATLTIVDDESTTVQFTNASYSVNENAGQALIEVTLSKAAVFSVTVDYAIAAGTATEGSDYTAANGTLVFNPGETSKTIAVTIVDDTVFENSETVTLSLSNVTPGSAILGTPTTATLTIVDNDSVPTVAFSSATSTVNEAAGNATITVNLSAASSVPVSVTYATSNGTAMAGSDYTATSGTLTFAPGETSKTFTVAILNDSLDEADETVNLTLSAPNGATLGIPATAVLTIVDDDAAPTVQFESAAISKNENAGVVEIVVTLSAASGRQVTVSYATSNGTAIEGEDYAAALGTLTFGAGETRKVIELSLLNDAIDENNETLSITLSNPVNATLGTPATVTVTIIDNDGSTVENYQLYLPFIRQ